MFNKEKIKKAIKHMKDRLKYCVLSTAIDKDVVELSIEGLEKQLPKEVETDTINRGIGVSGEYDIDFNMLCPNCKEVVGDYEADELYYKHCPNCGQKLKYTEQQE
ncbi:hypothetical protein [Clostridium weizhouense]|uniref:Uncharacterized protein n=1 Tax=Clostridium weizhouense TaxID=2859781 RepID=A0ABS7AK01_9CLOT|nr:hypothetical protein [Clostridium weizhouense]MBW6408998.1 hypothetical protein [Clostridium weizhouense]